MKKQVKATKKSSVFPMLLALGGAGLIGYGLFGTKNANAAPGDVLFPNQDNNDSGNSNTGNGTVVTSSSSHSSRPTTSVQRRSKPVNRPLVARQWLANKFPLRRGMQGELVGALQVYLRTLGAKIKADGKFGPATEAALLGRRYKVPVDAAAFAEIKKMATAMRAPSPLQRLITLGYHEVVEARPAIELERQIKLKVPNPSKLQRDILRGNDKALLRVARAYEALTGRRLDADLFSIGKVSLNSIALKIRRLLNQGVNGLGAVVVDTATIVKSGTGKLTVGPGTVIGHVVVSVNDGVASVRTASGSLVQVPVSDIRTDE